MPRRSRFYVACEQCADEDDDRASTTWPRKAHARIRAQAHNSQEHNGSDVAAVKEVVDGAA